MAKKIKGNPKIIAAGREARERGLPPTACPYPRGTAKARAWLSGWGS